MTEEQNALLECFRISADFCSRSNIGKDRIVYNHNDLQNLALNIGRTVGIIKMTE